MQGVGKKSLEYARIPAPAPEFGLMCGVRMSCRMLALRR